MPDLFPQLEVLAMFLDDMELLSSPPFICEEVAAVAACKALRKLLRKKHGCVDATAALSYVKRLGAACGFLFCDWDGCMEGDSELQPVTDACGGGCGRRYCQMQPGRPRASCCQAAAWRNGHCKECAKLSSA